MLNFFADNAITIIDGLALIVIVIETIEVFLNRLRYMLPAPSDHLVRYALADRRSDIPTRGRHFGNLYHHELGRDQSDGAVAPIRTFLDSFLETP